MVICKPISNEASENSFGGCKHGANAASDCRALQSDMQCAFETQAFFPIPTNGTIWTKRAQKSRAITPYSQGFASWTLCRSASASTARAGHHAGTARTKQRSTDQRDLCKPPVSRLVNVPLPALTDGQAVHLNLIYATSINFRFRCPTWSSAI